jgi:hypothetical protein
VPGVRHNQPDDAFVFAQRTDAGEHRKPIRAMNLGEPHAERAQNVVGVENVRWLTGAIGIRLPDGNIFRDDLIAGDFDFI